MSHELFFDETKPETAPIFTVGTAPWHRLGKILQNAPTIEEGIKLAGLDWEVGIKPLFTGKEASDGIWHTESQVNANATYRKDTNEVLGVVGSQWRPLQNIEAFKFFQPFIDSGAATLESAGSLSGGKRVWVLAKINAPARDIVDGDAVQMYVLLSNGHDGSLAVRAGFTPVRVVCNNTLVMAHENVNSKLIRVRHTKSVATNLEKVQQIMNLATAEFEATVEQYKALASKEVNKKDVEEYVKIVFSQRAGQKNAGSKVLPEIIRLMETGRGSDIAGVQGTLWGLYNATQELLQYERGESEEGRMNSLWYGQGAQINRKAFETALDMLKIAA